MSERDREDLPKIVASVMVAAPSLAFKTGFAYLRMRRKAHGSAKVLRAGLIKEGMPENLADELSSRYESDLRIKTFIKQLGFPGR